MDEMEANYHTHTTRCGHASGEPWEYVEQGIKNGIKVLGFSDHVPYPYHNGYRSGAKMAVEETGAYVASIAALRETYRDKIRLLIGYEAEYYPDEFEAMLQNIGQYECDYLILGQHYTKNEYDGDCSTTPTKDKAVLTRYVNQTIEAMETGLFSYFAHPDMLYYVGEDTFYEKEMTRLCRAARELEVPLEINLLGMENRRHYPRAAFWQIAAREKNEVVLGCDAHRPEAVGNPVMLQRAYAYAKKFGIEPIQRVKLKRVF